MKRKRSFLKQKSYVVAVLLMVVAVLGMAGVYYTERSNEKMKEDLQARQGELDLETAELPVEEEELTAPVEKIIKPENREQGELAEIAPIDGGDTAESPSSIEGVTEEDSTGGAAEEDSSENANSTEEAVEKEEPADNAKESISVTEPQQPALHFNSEISWPLQGNVILNYSMDQTVYFATLDQYKYNPAIIIQGEVNEKVLSVATGQVSNIETNEETGCTVTVDLGDGYSAVYGQLKEVDLHAGDYVEAGAVIGYVSEPTKYYSVEGPNLYFQLLKSNQSINPMEYLQ